LFNFPKITHFAVLALLHFPQYYAEIGITNLQTNYVGEEIRRIIFLNTFI